MDVPYHRKGIITGCSLGVAHSCYYISKKFILTITIDFYTCKSTTKPRLSMKRNLIFSAYLTHFPYWKPRLSTVLSRSEKASDNDYIFLDIPSLE
jgi:hypothetical protein